jgi:hypothetical protein
MLDRELAHREVPWVPGRERRSDRDGRCRNEAVGLAQRDAARRKLTPPGTRPLALTPTERRESQREQQPPNRSLFAR